MNLQIKTDVSNGYYSGDFTTKATTKKQGTQGLLYK